MGKIFFFPAVVVAAGLLTVACVKRLRSGIHELAKMINMFRTTALSARRPLRLMAGLGDLSQPGDCRRRDPGDTRHMDPRRAASECRDQLYSSRWGIPEPLRHRRQRIRQYRVGDTGSNRLVELTSTGQFIKSLNGTTNGAFNTPIGIGIDSAGDLWVAEFDASQIQECTASGQWIRTLGTSTSGTGNGQFTYPCGVAVDSFGHVWVADYGNSRVQEFDQNGNYFSKFGSLGSGNGQFESDPDIVAAPSGNLWVGDRFNCRVQEFDNSGTYLAQFGSAGSGNGQFNVNGPTGLAIDRFGNIWVSDWGNDRVEEFNSMGQYITQFGSDGSGNGQFVGPQGLAFDSSGNLWVVNQDNSRIQNFSVSPEPSSVALLIAGAACLLAFAWRRRRAK